MTQDTIKYQNPEVSNSHSTKNLAELSDSSEDENESGPLLRVGNIPLKQYENYGHLGYNLNGQPIERSIIPDKIDEFLIKHKNTVYDELNHRFVHLSNEEIRQIHRIRHNKMPANSQALNFVKRNLGEVRGSLENFPLHTENAAKHSFTRSKFEKQRILRMVNAIRNGQILTDEQRRQRSQAYKAKQAYLIQSEDSNDMQNEDSFGPNSSMNKKRLHGPPSIAPSKPDLPGHAESYRPPTEYLPNQSELEKWEDLDPEDRPYNFLPQKFDALRRVPLYTDFIRERYERCLDLYLCPRVRRKKLNIDPESLIPVLPKPNELRPFPNQFAMTYTGHKNTVSSLSVSSCGTYLVSGSLDKSVRLQEVVSGRCLNCQNLDVDSEFDSELGALSEEEQKDEEIEKVDNNDIETNETLTLKQDSFRKTAVYVEYNERLPILMIGFKDSSYVEFLDTTQSILLAEQNEKLENESSFEQSKSNNQSSQIQHSLINNIFEYFETGTELKTNKNENIETEKDFDTFKSEEVNEQDSQDHNNIEDSEIDDDEESNVKNVDESKFIKDFSWRSICETSLTCSKPQIPHLYNDQNRVRRRLRLTLSSQKAKERKFSSHILQSFAQHPAGDFFATVTKARAGSGGISSSSDQSTIVIHRLSDRKSQSPFIKSLGYVQQVLFHPNKHWFFIATKKHVQIWNFECQQLVKRLQPSTSFISSIALHPSTSDHIIVGTYDMRLSWFDLDLSNKPYRTLKYHKRAIQKVCWHKTYPLFASCSNDGTAHIFHGRVYSDLMTDPLIVPLKVLNYKHENSEKRSKLLDCLFHPNQPWIFVCGTNDSFNIRLYNSS